MGFCISFAPQWRFEQDWTINASAATRAARRILGSLAGIAKREIRPARERFRHGRDLRTRVRSDAFEIDIWSHRRQCHAAIRHCILTEQRRLKSRYSLCTISRDRHKLCVLGLPPLLDVVWNRPDTAAFVLAVEMSAVKDGILIRRRKCLLLA